jgi:hypothetical protein
MKFAVKCCKIHVCVKHLQTHYGACRNCEEFMGYNSISAIQLWTNKQKHWLIITLENASLPKHFRVRKSRE